MESEHRIAENLKKIINLLESNNYQYALAGGLAFSALIEPRATLDIDMVLLVDEINFPSLANHFLRIFPDMIIHPKPMIFSQIKIWRMINPDNGKDLIIDFLLAENDFLKNILERVIEINFMNLIIKTITLEDLVILKLLAHRKQDLADIEKILLAGKNNLDYSYIKKWTKALNLNSDLLY
jgi:hypothetical protein